jgi:hypothetical protein
LQAQNAFVNGRYDEAIQRMQKLDPPDRDKLLQLMELGTFYHAKADYDGSNGAFLEASKKIQEYDDRAAVSLRDSGAFAASLLINDKTLPYRGAPFERVLVHMYLAMNYLMQRNLEDARVEILQGYAVQKSSREEHEKSIAQTRQDAAKQKLETPQLLGKIQESYADQRGLLAEAGNTYQNAFTYYLSSLVYEMRGETSDAYLDAKTVYSLNPNFLPVRRDLLRYSKALGRSEEYDRWRKLFGPNLPDTLPVGAGEVVVLYECGLAPTKEEIRINVPIPVKDHWNLIMLAIPKYRLQPNPVQAATLLVGGKPAGTTEALMSLRATAVEQLWDEALGIALRQLIRAAGRVVMTEQLRQQGGDAALLLGLVAGYVAEQADLRSWESLPDNFQVLRVSVPAGNPEMELCLERPGTALGRIALGNVPVQVGRVTLINLRSTGVRGTAKYASF